MRGKVRQARTIQSGYYRLDRGRCSRQCWYLVQGRYGRGLGLGTGKPWPGGNHHPPALACAPVG